MVITDKFVYIHKPKTGGSFVTEALLQLYGVQWSRLLHARLALTGKVRFTKRHGELILTSDKHGGYAGVNTRYRDREIVTTIRNPFDYYVSQYIFGWWKRKEWLRYYRDIPGFKLRFSAFPDLNFRQYMELSHLAFNPPGFESFYALDQPGVYTVECIQMYFRDPAFALREMMSAGYHSKAGFLDNMVKVRFLQTESLNRQLYEFLKELGYPESEISFILEKGRVLPHGKGRNTDQNWRRYFDDELIELIKAKDAFLFRLFPEYLATASL